MRTQTNLLKVLHKQIILIFSSEVVQKAGELSEGWNKEDHNHIQHTSDVLTNKRNILQKQFENTDFTKEDNDSIKRFYNMLVKDLKNMIFNVQNDKLPDGLVTEARAYLNDMKDMIDSLKELIN